MRSFSAANILNNGIDGGREKDVASPQSRHGDSYFILCLGIGGTLALASQALESIRNVCYLLRKQRGEAHRRKSIWGIFNSLGVRNAYFPRISKKPE